jgi:integrase/recombinase XerD
MAKKKRELGLKKGKNYNTDPTKARLGCEPFREGIRYYIVRKEAYMNGETPADRTRKLLLLADVFEDLKKQKRIESTHPRKIEETDIEAFLVWMKGRDLQNSTKRKYIHMLKSYLGFFGNHIIADMQMRDLLKFPEGEKDVEFIEEDDLVRIFQHIDKMQGYNGVIMRGYFALMFGTAGRVGEIKDAYVEDLIIEETETGYGSFYVRHPKGEGSYGLKQWIPIVRGDMIPFIERFLKEREEYLEFRGIDSRYLFVNISKGLPYSGNGLRQMKSRIEKETGVDFKLKHFRATYATLTYRYEPEKKETTSKIMRHKYSKTTEKYYIAADHKEAAKRNKNSWEKSAIKMDSSKEN